MARADWSNYSPLEWRFGHSEATPTFHNVHDEGAGVVMGFNLRMRGA
jgi:hypothetical protein